MAVSASPCDPIIRIVEEAGAATVEARCAGSLSDHHNGEYRYELIVDRTGPAGTSRSKQSGTFTPGTSSADTLARTRVNLTSGDELHARLSIIEGDTVLKSRDIRRVLP